MMQKQHVVHRVPDTDSVYASHACKAAPAVVLDNFPWDAAGYCPYSEAKLLYSSTAFYVLMRTFDDFLKAELTNHNDPVCQDSCLEFFLNPVPDRDQRYLNFEMNALGTILLGVGTNRHGRTLVDPATYHHFQVECSLDTASVRSYYGQGWSIRYQIPFAFLERIYGPLSLGPGSQMQGNFYKCGDGTPYPHYGCWNPIGTTKPDFHRPEYFGTLVLADAKPLPDAFKAV